MPLSKLEHYLILSDDVEATKDFYVNVLGLRVGERPPFPFPGYWLYLGAAPCVHLASSAASSAQKEYMGRDNDGSGTGAIDHVAFTATDLDATVAFLEGAGIGMIRRDVPEQQAHQVFIQDPNGITVELNFRIGARA
jgi:catechol 2,3-dioxygenase-like lactoylglutathione lyase family enzyme